MPRPDYPTSARLDLVEVLHGRAVADPYRWLEDADAPETQEWSAAQDRLARAHLDALPGRERLAARLERAARDRGRSARRPGAGPAVLDPPRSPVRSTPSC